MLTHYLPLWGSIVVLAAVLIAKYLVISRVERTTFITHLLDGKGWMAILNIISALNALVTFGLLLLVCGVFWAAVAALLDFAMHWFMGYYKAKKAMPTIDQGNIAQAEAWLTKIGKWFAAIHSASYIAIATAVIDFVQKHPDWVKQGLALLHLG